ncbi:MAG: hypothetical protein NC313_16495 [Butyrivibrio sp.]|nr:hypothetical protein [Butyrivibrio sp.]
MRGIQDFTDLDVYNRPVKCPKCGGDMVFKGCGEYRCEKCKYVDYDDYGKVRNYVEKHTGVTMAQAADATGVKQKTIRTMLKESRLEVADGSTVYLKCEMCGASIRSGRVCPKCEVAYSKVLEERARQKHEKMMSGFGMGRSNGEEGAKRFTRDQQ